MSKHTLVATVEEGPVVLNRVLSLFRQRSFAIESLSTANGIPAARRMPTPAGWTGPNVSA